MSNINMQKVALPVISSLLTLIIGLLGYIGLKTINGMESLHITLNEIRIEVTKVVVNHENLKENVNTMRKDLDKVEDKIDKKTFVYGK